MIGSVVVREGEREKKITKASTVDRVIDRKDKREK